MTKRPFVLAYLLLSGVALIGMDQSPTCTLNSSTDTLRSSQGALSRSQSQELSKLAKKALATIVYYDFRGNFKPVYQMHECLPVPAHHYHSDCP